jgi:glycosyltransferase involved in cell wall biosynthesis
LIFFANVLVMNGGSTFLVRTSRELKRRGVAVAIVLLRKEVDPELLSELERFATVYYLEDFLIDKARLFRAHLGVFGFVAWRRLERALMPFGNVVHAMGVFGLLFGYRLCGRFRRFKLTAGVYHQNEFLFTKSKFYFAQKSAELFCGLPSENIVFFNETSRNNYAEFFSKNFSFSPIIPIGIDLPNPDKCAYSADSFRIVSIGNLVEFKTYNEHIIRVLPALLKVVPCLEYHIYGTGFRKDYLRSIIDDLRLERSVFFHGEIAYSDFYNSINNSSLFVGSGTALIEAAAAGLPAMIGIESIQTPDTYGFLSDIPGYSYNEDVPYISKKPIKDLLLNFFSNSEIRSETSKKCKLKASEFSVEKTIFGLIEVNSNASFFYFKISFLTEIRMVASFALMGLQKMLFRRSSFAERRNQSYERKQ